MTGGIASLPPGSPVAAERFLIASAHASGKYFSPKGLMSLACTAAFSSPLGLHEALSEIE